MTDIDPRARSPKSRSNLTEQEKQAERDRDRDRANGAIIDIGLGCTWKQPIRSE